MKMVPYVMMGTNTAYEKEANSNSKMSYLKSHYQHKKIRFNVLSLLVKN